MMRIILLSAALVAAGVAVFDLCPGNLFGPEWLVVETPDGPTDIRNPPASDWWVVLGSALFLAGWLVLLLASGGQSQRCGAEPGGGAPHGADPPGPAAH